MSTVKPYHRLKESLKDQDTATIRALITAHPEVLEQADESGISGLMLIAYFKNAEALRLATKHKSHWSIHEAAACGLLDKVTEIIEDHSDALQSFSKDGFPPLTLACYFGHLEVARYLIQQGANLNVPAENPSKVTALHSAVASNDYEICKLLVTNGADVNTPQTQGVTALHSAAHRGNLDIVRLLVAHGARVKAKMDNGDSALDLAKKDGHSEVVDFLKSRE